MSRAAAFHYFAAMIRSLILLVLCVVADLQPVVSQRLAFGSCSRHTSENQLWEEVNAEKPDMWIWSGDNIYADTHDMRKMRLMYEQQKNRTAYQKLREQATVYGTWDDHDYGVNDGGKFFSMKDPSKELLLDFLDVPVDAKVRNHTGVYQSYITGTDQKKIKILLLDTRYFRDTLMPSATKGKRYEINPDGDILGEAQWEWLKTELTNSEAAVNIIVSSIQFIANDHGFEKWGNFPRARKRMIDLLEEVKPNFTFFISGDRHIAEVSRMNLPGLSYPLYDITSSGLTHTWSVIGTEENKARVSPLIVERNFGVIDIRWKGKLPKTHLRIIGPKGKVLHAQVIQ